MSQFLILISWSTSRTPESVNNALRAFLAIGKEVESASIHILRKAPRAVSSKRNVTFDPRKGSALKTKAAAK